MSDANEYVKYKDTFTVTSGLFQFEARPPSAVRIFLENFLLVSLCGKQCVRWSVRYLIFLPLRTGGVGNKLYEIILYYMIFYYYFNDVLIALVLFLIQKAPPKMLCCSLFCAGIENCCSLFLESPNRLSWKLGRWNFNFCRRFNP